MEKINWGHRKNGYTVTPRQINKLKGYQVNYYKEDFGWGEDIGFMTTLKEAKSLILIHMKGKEGTK